jgi:putative thiamine transport system ATP-binding protein
MVHRLGLDNVVIWRRGQRLVEVDATVAAGEVLTVMGPSGSGKSTLLAFIAGLIDPAFTAEGRVLLDGRDVTSLPPEARRIGLLFQDPLLFPHLSVASNLLFGVGRDAADRRGKVQAALASAGLEGFGDRDPATLSGGQRARVALMRVLLSEPHALLLDEPFSKLDTELKDDIRGFVFERVRAEGLPTLLVTHDPADAASAGGPVIHLGG